MKTRTLVVMTIISLIVSVKSFSNTIKVTTGTDSIPGSLRDAINNAQSGDIITFDNSLTEIKLGEQIAIDKSITISGNPNLLIHINKGYILYRIFEINGTDAITVNINNLILKKTQSCYFTDTVSYNADGGIMFVNNTNSTVNINSCNFTGYGTQSGGGYIKFYNLNGQNGGAIAQYGGVLNISNCTFSYLYSSTMAYWGVGGAIYQAFGEMNLVNCTFYKNECLLNGNKNMGFGAAIHSQNSTISFTNCTFCNNITSESYWTTTTPPTYITLTTYVISLYKSNLTIKNSILYDNDGNRDIIGSINSGGYNIFGQTTVTGSVSSDLFNCNPGFILNGGIVVLSNNTFWIPVCALEDSTGCAIDALPTGGNGAPQYDERGFKRFNSPDIGAYEYKGTNPTGIPALINVDLIKIYPDPAIDYIKIETQQQVVINISNIQGQLVKTLTASGNTTNVDVSALPSGVYIMEVKTKKGVVVEKFVKE
jgi:Secretion system C-terminal sorting domain